MNPFPKDGLFIGVTHTRDIPQGSEGDLVRLKVLIGVFPNYFQIADGPADGNAETHNESVDFGGGVVGRSFMQLELGVMLIRRGFGRITLAPPGFHSLVGKNVSFVPDRIFGALIVWQGEGTLVWRDEGNPVPREVIDIAVLASQEILLAR